MAFNPMDMNLDGRVDFTDYILFNTFINPSSPSYYKNADGYRDPESSALVHKVADYLADSPNDTIETGEFRSACYACGVDPDSFTQEDFAQLEQELHDLP